MPRYKRTADEAQLDIPLEPEVAPENVETLDKLRNMWEFAALMEYIHLFGDVVKIDQKIEIEVGEIISLHGTLLEKANDVRRR
jgi:hypothetical protein